jgi:hypothetical protein
VGSRVESSAPPRVPHYRGGFCGSHFLLMTSLGVRDFRVNALIPHRRGEESRPLCSAGGAVRCSSLIPGGSLPCGMVFSTVSCAPPLEAARAVSGPKQEPRKNQSDPCRAINCARATHVSSLLPATLLLPVIAHTVIVHTEIAHTVDRTSVDYPRSRGKRAPTMPIGAYRLPPHGPHAEQMEGPLFLSMEYN